MAAGLRQDVHEVMDNFAAGIDQPSVDSTIAAELNAMLQALGVDAAR
jgi:hypothetical protein